VGYHERRAGRRQPSMAAIPRDGGIHRAGPPWTSTSQGEEDSDNGVRRRERFATFRDNTRSRHGSGRGGVTVCSGRTATGTLRWSPHLLAHLPDIPTTHVYHHRSQCPQNNNDFCLPFCKGVAATDRDGAPRLSIIDNVQVLSTHNRHLHMSHTGRNHEATYANEMLARTEVGTGIHRSGGCYVPGSAAWREWGQ
jgi:hypothetical protein